MKKTKIITICSSASFYRHVIKARRQLERMGFKVKIPIIAARMAKRGDFNVENHKTWFKNPKDYNIKTRLMKYHFRKVEKCDAVLILNYKKRGIDGYIGGNVLMEMAVAFQNKKPIYILNPIIDNLSIKEEIFGLQPEFINGDLTKIS